MPIELICKWKRQKMKKDILGDRLAKKIIKKGTVI